MQLRRVYDFYKIEKNKGNQNTGGRKVKPRSL